jgi:hypothetical protein
LPFLLFIQFTEKEMVRKYTDKELLDKVKKICNFTGIPTGRWILGVRSKEDTPNHFDDKFYEFEGEKFIQVLSGTTNPATSILKGGYKQYNPLGAAVVMADTWYYNLWTYGLHKKRMPALLQLGSTIAVYRDGDNDGKSEELGKPIYGWYGINYHTNTYDFSAPNLKVKRPTIDGWSAGCQVINDREKYIAQMKWYRENQKTQKYVSYCLINEF